MPAAGEASGAHLRLWTPETVTRLYDEVVRLLHVNVQQAERIGRAASADGGEAGRRALARGRAARHGPHFLSQAPI